MSLVYIYKKEEPAAFTEALNNYVDNNTATFRYLPEFFEYMLFYSTTLISDESFVVLRDKQAIGVAFLPIEKHNELNQISLAGGYTLAPLSFAEDIEKEIYAKIDTIVEHYNIKKILFYLDPLLLEYKNKFNQLRKYGFFDTSSSDCLVDLRVSKEKLWSNIRKSYKSLINGIMKGSEFEIIHIDHKNADYTVHETYRHLHAKCSGRVTRSKETFDKQFEMLDKNYGSLFGLKYKGIYIGFNYFLHFQKTVVYMSGVDDPDYENEKIPIYHALLWSATLYYKQNGFEFMQFSQPCGYAKVSAFDDYLDEKHLNISHFKQGMGSTMTPLFRGIKYSDQNIFLLDIQKLQKNILND